MSSVTFIAQYIYLAGTALSIYFVIGFIKKKWYRSIKLLLKGASSSFYDRCYKNLNSHYLKTTIYKAQYNLVLNMICNQAMNIHRKDSAQYINNKLTSDHTQNKVYSFSVPIGTELFCIRPGSIPTFVEAFGVYCSVCSVENHLCPPWGALIWLSLSWNTI